jgi:hypothetical protein
MKDSLTKLIIDRKDFSYIKGPSSLKFNLRIDNSSELKPFKSCLEEAIKDIDEILKGMRN